MIPWTQRDQFGLGGNGGRLGEGSWGGREKNWGKYTSELTGEIWHEQLAEGPSR